MRSITIYYLLEETVDTDAHLYSPFILHCTFRLLLVIRLIIFILRIGLHFRDQNEEYEMGGAYRTFGVDEAFIHNYTQVI
jgi:hypothetical protein